MSSPVYDSTQGEEKELFHMIITNTSGASDDTSDAFLVDPTPDGKPNPIFVIKHLDDHTDDEVNTAQIWLHVGERKDFGLWPMAPKQGDIVTVTFSVNYIRIKEFKLGKHGVDTKAAEGLELPKDGQIGALKRWKGTKDWTPVIL